VTALPPPRGPDVSEITVEQTFSRGLIYQAHARSFPHYRGNFPDTPLLHPPATTPAILILIAFTYIFVISESSLKAYPVDNQFQ
jgi:hypothetical protein